MLDALIKPRIDPLLDRLMAHPALCRMKANHITLVGFGFGLGTMGALFLETPLLAGFFLILNRLCDGLDGAAARHHGITSFGGFLDIVCDFIIYTGVVFALTLTVDAPMIYGLMLLFSMVGPMVSFLAYAIIAAQKGHMTQRRGKKSFYYLGGLAEGTETFLILWLMCVMPWLFVPLSLLFSLMCWVTTLGRIHQARRAFP